MMSRSQGLLNEIKSGARQVAEELSVLEVIEGCFFELLETVIRDIVCQKDLNSRQVPPLHWGDLEVRGRENNCYLGLKLDEFSIHFYPTEEEKNGSEKFYHTIVAKGHFLSRTLIIQRCGHLPKYVTHKLLPRLTDLFEEMGFEIKS